MEENKEISGIEKIKLQLEQKLLEIEKRKKAESNSKIAPRPSKKEEKTLIELRKELQELQKNNTEKVKEVKKELKSTLTDSVTSITQAEKDVKNSISSKEIEKPLITSKTEDVKEAKITKERTKANTQKTAAKKVAKNISSSIKNDILAKKPIVTIKETPKKPSSTRKAKESTIARNKIIFIIAFAFALLYLGYLYKLNVDLNKEKEALEKKKIEQIDYSKKDAVFKEVEEEPTTEELQDIK